LRKPFLALIYFSLPGLVNQTPQYCFTKLKLRKPFLALIYFSLPGPVNQTPQYCFTKLELRKLLLKLEIRALQPSP